MRGFKIICKTERGEEVLLQNLNTNKKVFTMITLKEKPFLIMSFLFKSNARGKMIKRVFDLAPDSEGLHHVSRKLVELGAEENKDFDLEVIV